MAKRWQERHEFYQRAVKQLTSGLALYPNLNDLEKDGAIQRFEFTFELAWKTLQDYFAQESGYADVKGLRTALKQSVSDNLIIDGYTWLKMLDSHNELAHVYVYVYDETVSRQILDDVVNKYLHLLQQLEQTLTTKL